MEERLLHVKDMHCDHCKMSITRALRGLAGVSDVDINLDTKKVRVRFDPQATDEGAIRSAIAESGFDVA